MDILTEADLRSGRVKKEDEKVFVKKGTFVTPLAQEYIKANGLELEFLNPSSSLGSFGKGIMSYTPIPKSGNHRFEDFQTGEWYAEKPEHMTHLKENVLVSKNHPRILFRGKLDSLEALIMQTQLIAADNGYEKIAEDLDEVMLFVQAVLASEVKDEPLPDLKLLGMNAQRLRYVSHNLSQEFGLEHSVPHYSMGVVCAWLNALRTSIREAELAAVDAFLEGNKITRPDIIQALNRLSSCVYIMFCKKVAGQYDQG